MTLLAVTMTICTALNVWSMIENTITIDKISKLSKDIGNEENEDDRRFVNVDLQINDERENDIQFEPIISR